MSLVIAAVARPSRAAPQVKRYVLTMMHFNIQYVAGGLVGFLPDSTVYDRSAEDVEDMIIKQSFEPVLDLFMKHPGWGADMEIQGYMLDVIAARHPTVLDKLRTLAKAGQIEVPSFHYSDQLFLAHPKEEWSRSADLTRATFAAHDVPIGDAVFCQEGQAGMGMAAAMKSKGYSYLVWPKNLFGYQYTKAAAPLYRFGDAQMITTNNVAYQDSRVDLGVTWSFVDDGELLATGGIDPYFPDTFKTDPAAVASYEQSLMALETSGYQIVTVRNYLQAISGLVPAVDPPPLLDGTWQPNSTGGIHKWLGGAGVWASYERDNDVRTLLSVAHRELVSAELVAQQAGLDAKGDIDAGFRLLSLGEVSDASGINPFRGEVEYGIAHATEAMRIARDVITRAKAALGESAVRIDVPAGAVVPQPGPPEWTDATPPLDVQADGGGRDVQVSWSQRDGVSRVEIRFAAGDSRDLSVRFPGQAGDYVYTPGLMDAPVHVPRNGFAFRQYELALSDGLIGLGTGFVVADQARVHVSASVQPDNGDVVFTDATAPAGEEIAWVFYYVSGTDAAAETQATQLARSINVLPVLWR